MSQAYSSPGAGYFVEQYRRYDLSAPFWNEFVLGFDAQRQDRMLQSLGIERLGAARLGLMFAAANRDPQHRLDRIGGCEFARIDNAE